MGRAKKPAASKRPTGKRTVPSKAQGAKAPTAPPEAAAPASEADRAGDGPEQPTPPPQPAVDADLVVLENISTESFTANLTHEDYCQGSGECLCRWVTLRITPQQQNGSGGAQERKVRRNASITILAKTKSRPLHRAVLAVPGVQSALRAPNRRLISRNGG